MMIDLVLPGITLAIGLPIAMWLTSPRRARRGWQYASAEVVPVLAGHPARLLPGPASTAGVVRGPGLPSGRSSASENSARRDGRAAAATDAPSQLVTPLDQLTVVDAEVRPRAMDSRLGSASTTACSPHGDHKTATGAGSDPLDHASAPVAPNHVHRRRVRPSVQGITSHQARLSSGAST